MTTQIRSVLTLSLVVIILAGCGTTVGALPSDDPSPSAPATPSDAPSEEPSEAPAEPSVAPSEPVAEERKVNGTITMAYMAFSGPGGTIQEALDAGPTGNDLPTLVNGVLFRDTDGRIYIASSIDDDTVPSFTGPMLEVLNMASDSPSFDMDRADMLGIEEVDGIVFNRTAQMLGFLELP